MIFTLSEFSEALLVPYLPMIVAFSCKVASDVDLDDGVRLQALEQLRWLAEVRGSIWER